MTNSGKEKIVYFVRHGQSEDNAAPVFQSPDSPLSLKGIEQAKRIAERISKLTFETLISSPLQRAKQTADVISEATGKEPELCDMFVERIKPTIINGKSYEDDEANAIWRQWEKSLYTPGERVMDGENFDDLFARTDKALTFLRNREEQSLVVITHGYFLRTIIARVLIGNLVLGEQYKNFQKAASIENTGLTVLKYQPSFEEEASWRLWTYNDHSHLAE